MQNSLTHLVHAALVAGPAAALALDVLLHEADAARRAADRRRRRRAAQLELDGCNEQRKKELSTKFGVNSALRSDAPLRRGFTGAGFNGA